MSDTTISLTPSTPIDRQGIASPALVLASCALRPLEPPMRIPLDEIDEIVFGRGPQSARRSLGDRRLRVDLLDGGTSTDHARLLRDERGWTISDLESKNGTLVDGRRVTSTSLGPDSVLEIGSSFFILRDAVDPIAGPGPLRTLSPRLARDLALFARVAAARVPILITGDTGTGKELFARTAHELSRRTGPFIAVNCGAFPEALVESELFGARKGAYSGATTDRLGAVAAADRGTLFLDEIAELPLVSQAALLRFLQEGEIRPLGAPRAHRVDVRVLAATHQNLGQLVAAGTFRDDLYARLRGHVLALPPLSARREDLGLLVARILLRIAPERAHQISLQRAVARILLTHPWPHNVRELEQVFARAIALLETDNEIRIEHLTEELVHPSSAVVPGTGQRARLVALLRVHNGNLSAVARALATSRSQVHRLLERHQLRPAG
jgi:transcriptional regulator of acetoin/glycerol metabolism